ncbi:hypothetical protein PNOK_0418100 [Pyrrhoderma noxium]|uniref:DUF6533 domain-containing protein n=1 Tax=Pyrrhoderma noxium TaxID=2282107 RepID=A0A286UI75_9AGAM|nr:hypothetical protein PNOK_0418100 [Pyrrhoderma noxium]
MTETACSGALCAEINTISTAVNAIRLTKLCNLSSCILFVYDFVSSMDREYRLMWTPGLSVGKALFFLIRYYTLVTIVLITLGMFHPNPSHEVGGYWARFHWVSGAILSTLTEASLQIRMYAIYNRSKWILSILVISLAMTISAMAIIARIILQEQKAFFLSLGDSIDMHICDVSNLPSLFRFWWTPALVNETLLVLLAVIRGIQNFKEYGSRNAMRSFVMSLVKDSLLYFIAVFAFYLVAQLFWLLKDKLYLEIPVGYSIAMQGIMSQRLLLNVRERFSSPTAATLVGSLSTGQEESIARSIPLRPMSPYHLQSRKRDYENEF